jgi:hypothetical protein
MQAFFHHYSTHFALTRGWDLESSYDDFVASNREMYENSIALDVKDRLTGKVVSVTELDIYNLSVGVVSNREFADILLQIAETEEGTILVSAHSGSSDMLTPEKVLATNFLKN